MRYKCKHCDYTKETGSSYMTSEDYQEIFNHEREHTEESS